MYIYIFWRFLDHPSIHVTHCYTAAGVQYDGNRHLALQVEFGEVEHLLSQDLLLLHPPDAVEAEADGVVADHLRLDVAEAEGFGEDGTGASGDACFGTLLFYFGRFVVGTSAYLYPDLLLLRIRRIFLFI